jgi:hypothetical protein
MDLRTPHADGVETFAELRAQALVVRPQDRLYILRIELLRASREPDQVGKRDGDNLSLPMRVGHASSLGRVGEPLHSRGVPLP